MDLFVRTSYWLLRIYAKILLSVDNCVPARDVKYMSAAGQCTETKGFQQTNSTRGMEGFLSWPPNLTTQKSEFGGV